jgi:hypothetical protein
MLRMFSIFTKAAGVVINFLILKHLSERRIKKEKDMKQRLKDSENLFEKKEKDKHK